MSDRAAAAGIVLRLNLIGQMEAWTLTSDSVLPAGRKTRALLAVIAMASPRPALRGRLSELLWSRRPEEQARASLRQEIHRLLDLMTSAGVHVLNVTRDHIGLLPGTVWIDADEILKSRTIEPRGLALMRGDLLEDLDGIDPAFDTWLTTERERLRDRARLLAEDLLRQKQEPDATIRLAQRLLDIDRAHEGAWRALMRAHAARGERGMAIQAYDRCRAVLADLLDASPSAETQSVLKEIRGPASGRTPLRPPWTADNEAPAAIAAAEPPRVENRVPVRGARVGVMPLRLIGASEEEAHLGESLAEEITTALSRFRWLFLVSSSSLARFAAEDRDEAVRRAFGIDFLMDGTVQRAQNRMRVTVRLLDLRSGSQMVWAHRFDHEASDLLALQDQIAAELVARIDPEILLIEAKRVSARPLSNPTAYDLLLRAMPPIQRMERESFLRAGEHLRQAIALEPDYAAAHAWRAYWNIFLVGQGWAQRPAESLAEAGRLAERAISLDPSDARALTIAGHVRAFLDHRLHEAKVLHERALSINPNLAMAWALAGATSAYLGELEEAERQATRYKRLSPLDPHAFVFDTIICFILLLKRDFEQAAAVGRAVTSMNPSFSNACKPYLSALGFLGLADEAKSVRKRLHEIEPDFTIDRFLRTTPFARPEHRELFAEGLRRAGLS